MGKPSKQVMKFMEAHGIESDEVWEVHGSTWVVKHKALERVAAEKGITFEPPQLKVCDLEKGIVVVLVTGKLGDRAIHSFGEATPKNCKNAYMVAMAEKRAVDRVILKLLAAHGDLYSEEEADDFKRQNPHVTRAADILPATQYDQHGEVIDNIPAPSPDSVKKLRVVDQRPIFEALQKEIHSTGTVLELQEWATANKDRLGALKPDWQDFLRGVYAEQLSGLRELARGDDNRMAG